MEQSDKQRYELKEHYIRAYYIHSLEKKIKKETMPPSIYFYHGTARRFVPLIMKDGIKPMQRQYVHISKDRKTAIQVGTRHDQKSIILKIVALQAYLAGILFYQDKQKVWLSEAIPSQYQQDE